MRQEDVRAGAAPEWLREVAAAASSMSVPARMRPSATEGRPSAVLVLFGWQPVDDVDVLLIQKTAGLRRHAGQPAFPGGAQEPVDSGPVACALREAQEETGLNPSGIEVLDPLPELYLPHSGFRITPVLAWWHTPTPVRPADPGEVAAVSRVPLTELADNQVRVRHPDGSTGPGFRVRRMLVWGFTGVILRHLLVLGGWVPERVPDHAPLVTPP
ncbi:CoA pyrophosphatase [Lipingzhangella sp. LS1_29]|uniref:CoA pyrophosphatase n=1 Tax=Lipingzhangella rawalii TaxID=2055835 RepID=A0ABU2H3Y3_9ACTN|nr:CoA pyrophosphatase [Lipingzhangella rawalii]MDS1270011.1 CoA pyrophosphatase [Lipingzhangella rawalii]